MYTKMLGEHFLTAEYSANWSKMFTIDVCNWSALTYTIFYHTHLWVPNQSQPCSLALPVREWKIKRKGLGPFPYCKRRKAGWGLGTRLIQLCFYTCTALVLAEQWIKKEQVLLIVKNNAIIFPYSSHSVIASFPDSPHTRTKNQKKRVRAFSVPQATES